MQVRSDGPFDKVRDWYRQFYNPRAEISAFHQRLDGTYTVHNVPGVPINVAA
jgi:3-ketosteroid 9alpha-monooxygenase subunit A